MKTTGNLTGRVFDIERFGLVDGPGIRTVVFFKGCPLRCRWCHNPESQDPRFEIMFSEDRCIRCGTCEEMCPNDAIRIDAESKSRHHLRERCTGCGRCVEVCPQKALERTGYDIQLDELMTEIVNGTHFYRRSGGGVTLSGGEPLLQTDFCKNLLKSCREEGIHTALDTSGYASWGELREVLPYVDLFLYDIKHLDHKKHHKWTGFSNIPVLDNLKRLAGSRNNGSYEITIRVPVIPGFNATETEIRDIFTFVKSLKRIQNVEILPFNLYGKSKYKKLGRDYEFRKVIPPGRTFLEQIREIGKKEGLNVSIGE